MKRGLQRYIPHMGPEPAPLSQNDGDEVSNKRDLLKSANSQFNVWE